MVSSMLNKLQNHSEVDEAMRLRMKILNRLSSEEQQRVKRGFGPQMQLFFYESQTQRKIAQQKSNTIQIDTVWDFGQGMSEHQDEFQEDFINESQNLEIRPLGKTYKKHNLRKLLRSVGQSSWTIVQLDELSGIAREGPRPVTHKAEIEITHQQKAEDSLSNINRQTQSVTTPYRNQNQNSKLNVDFMRMITSPFSVPKGIQLQQIAGEAVQVVGTRHINIQTAPLTQLQENHIHERKVEKKGGRTPVGSKATSTNTSFVANQNQSEDQQRWQPGVSLRTVPTYGNLEQNKGRDSYTGNLFQDANGGNITTSTKQGNWGKNNSLSRDVETKVEIVYTEKLEEELRENIIEEEYHELAKWFNPTFIIPKYHQKWRKILDASALNKEIQTIHFNINRTDQVRDQIGKGNWATSLDLKSAFHHLIAYPQHGPYQAFEAMGKVYQYRAMPLGTQHSSIFFVQALAMVLTKIMRESNIRILNYIDDLLLLFQNNERLREQIQTIMTISEAFGWIIAWKKCESQLNQQINFLRWAYDLKKMYLKIAYQRKQELHFHFRRFISLIERQVPIKVKYLASIRSKLIFLRVQVREASLYLKLMDSAKSCALNNNKWKENEILPQEILQGHYWWQGVIAKNQRMMLEVRISEVVMVSDTSPKSWGVTLELQTGDTLVQHGE
ncbi:MAG: hypothetical protein EZS28_008897 [Streblomastix strix]|uniref:Reverse transcriptase domain-containing protein n=1 Tax=Streblomastix strix TaxID=222440 RepID=A0A5J4WLY1_9EUKA|nr:MAG: hypothetical protein EZS28_008897 [Streblomastix strix]